VCETERQGVSPVYAYLHMHINSLKLWPSKQACLFWTRLLNLDTCGLSGETIAARELALELSQFRDHSMKSLCAARLVAGICAVALLIC